QYLANFGTSPGWSTIAMSSSAPPSRSAARPKLYIAARIYPRWRREAKMGKMVLAFSPFVTPPCAARILLSSFGQLELYTVVSAENFATGASSLGLLKKLLDNQVPIYHLHDLHAKILLVPGHAVTVGSQNMTQAGKRNREANIVLSDPESIARVEKEVGQW